MAQKQETKDTGPILRQLQIIGWFRKTNDLNQVAIPDILGVYRGFAFGIEIKSIKEVVGENVLVPPMTSHRFTLGQIQNLKSIEKNGGIGIGIIVCGRHAKYFYPSEINPRGQCNWNMNDYQNDIRFVKGEWQMKECLESLIDFKLAEAK